MKEAVSIVCVLKDGTIHAGQSTNGILRKDMDECYYVLEDGTKADALLREKRGKKS